MTFYFDKFFRVFDYSSFRLNTIVNIRKKENLNMVATSQNIAAQFDRADVNHDGTIDPQEFRTFMRSV